MQHFKVRCILKLELFTLEYDIFCEHLLVECLWITISERVVLTFVNLVIDRLIGRLTDLLKLREWGVFGIEVCDIDVYDLAAVFVNCDF